MFVFDCVAKAPAINFAENGILIEIKNSNSAIPFINCVPWSDYPHENERLFIGGRQPFHIIGLLHVPKSIDYSYYVKTMMMLTNLLNAYKLQGGEKLLDRYSNIGKKLIKKRLGLYNKSLPEYMIKIFNSICDERQGIYLDIGQLNKDYLYNLDDLWNDPNGFGNCYGYKKWKNIFINENEQIQFEQIIKLLPNINMFLIKYSEPIQNKGNVYRCKPSILITSSLLNNLLNILKPSKCKLKDFAIYNPSNDTNELKKLVNEYSKQFSKHNFNLVVGNRSYSPCYKKCALLGIIKK